MILKTIEIKLWDSESNIVVTKSVEWEQAMQHGMTPAQFIMYEMESAEESMREALLEWEGE